MTNLVEIIFDADARPTWVNGLHPGKAITLEYSAVERWIIECVGDELRLTKCARVGGRWTETRRTPVSPRDAMLAERETP